MYDRAHSVNFTTPVNIGDASKKHSDLHIMKKDYNVAGSRDYLVVSKRGAEV